MEKKINTPPIKTKRKIHRRKNTVVKGTAAIMLGIVVLAVILTNKPVERYILKADYLQGETELLNKVNTVEDMTEDVTENTTGEYIEENIVEDIEENTEESIDKNTEENTEAEAGTSKENSTESTTKRSTYKRLEVENILQNPELPTGCEITALTIILNYLGYDVSKTTMADYYLEKGEVGSTSPYKAFVGNPRDEDACGAFAPVIVKSAAKYLDSVDSGMNVYNVTGADYEELTEYVNQGHPVLVWETMWMAKPHEAAVWKVDGESIIWKSHEHAMVLIGYTSDTYIMADPLRGIYEYDKETTESRYEDMGKQAIVIY